MVARRGLKRAPADVDAEAVAARDEVGARRVAPAPPPRSPRAAEEYAFERAVDGREVRRRAWHLARGEQRGLRAHGHEPR